MGMVFKKKYTMRIPPGAEITKRDGRRVARWRLRNGQWRTSEVVDCQVSERQYERVLGFIRSAEEEGAECLTGGVPPVDSELLKGFFVSPTVFDRESRPVCRSRSPDSGCR